MKKKYLLYIHNDRFRLEPQKSALVNHLLDEHYALNDLPEMDFPVEVGLEPLADLVEITAPATVVDGLEKGFLAASQDNELMSFISTSVKFKPCRHGVDPKLCKFAKPNKPCKLK